MRAHRRSLTSSSKRRVTSVYRSSDSATFPKKVCGSVKVNLFDPQTFASLRVAKVGTVGKGHSVYKTCQLSVSLPSARDHRGRFSLRAHLGQGIARQHVRQHDHGRHWVAGRSAYTRREGIVRGRYRTARGRPSGRAKAEARHRLVGARHATNGRQVISTTPSAFVGFPRLV